MKYLILLAHLWYPHECCEDGHCKPVPCSAIEYYKEYALVYGLWIKADEIRVSPDGQCHMCHEEGRERLYCLFIPRGEV